jgi:xylulokinase
LLDSNNYDLRFNLDTLRGVGVPIDELRAIGGGSKSAVWLQLRADVLGKPVSVPMTSEAASLGAAILAAASVGHFPNAQAGAQAWVTVARTFEPDAAMREIYELKYGNYLKLYPSLKKTGIMY